MNHFLLKFLVVSYFFGAAHMQNVININDEDLQRLGENLIEYYFMRDLERSRMASNLQCRTVLFGMIQFIGITVSLVSSNLITSVVQSTDSSLQEAIPALTSNDTLKPSEMCKHDFGCDQNLCWRTCEDGTNSNDSWCYTSAIYGQQQSQLCSHSFQCSPCWDCIGSCFASKSSVKWVS